MTTDDRVKVTPQWHGRFLFGEAEQEARGRRIAVAIRDRKVSVADDDDLHGCIEDEREVCARAERDGRL